MTPTALLSGQWLYFDIWLCAHTYICVYLDIERQVFLQYFTSVAKTTSDKKFD